MSVQKLTLFTVSKNELKNCRRGDMLASLPQLVGRGGHRPYRPHEVGAYGVV